MHALKTQRSKLKKRFLSHCYILILVLLISGCIRTQKDIMMEQEIAHLKKTQKTLESEQSKKELFLRKSVINKDQTIEDIRTEIQVLSGKIEEYNFKQTRFLEEKIASLNNILKEFEVELNKLKAEIKVLKEAKTPLPAPQTFSELDMKALYNRAYTRYTKKDYKESLSDFQELLKRFPKTHYRENAHYFIGAIFFNLKRYEDAILAYEEIVKRFPNSKRLAEVNLKQGICFMKIGALNDAKYFFNQVIAKYPGSSHAKRAKEELKNIK